MFLEVAHSPSKAFDRLKETPALRLAIALLLLRWTVTPATTVTNMYLNRYSMFIPPPFGIDAHTYRFYEIFWYGPYGVLMMLAITLAMALIGRRLYHHPDISFRRSFEIVSLSFFAPWVISVPGDYVVTVLMHAQPAVLVAFHIAILAWECWLLSVGYRRVFDLPWNRCVFLGWTAGALFVALGGLLIR